MLEWSSIFVSLSFFVFLSFTKFYFSLFIALFFFFLQTFFGWCHQEKQCKGIKNERIFMMTFVIIMLNYTLVSETISVQMILAVLNGTWTLCDASAVLYHLSYWANWEMAVMWVHDKCGIEGEIHEFHVRILYIIMFIIFTYM